MDQWLIRTSRNRITGPFPREHVLQMIKKGDLTVEDEVCQANHYWFYLHEDDEVLKQLGIEISQSPKGTADADDDITVTSTQAVEQESLIDPDDEDTDSGIESDGEIPDLEEVSNSATDETAMITNRALREFQSKKKSAPASAPTQMAGAKAIYGVQRTEKEISHYKPVVLGKIERASFWRGFALAMAGVVLLLVGIVVYVLRRG